MRISETRRRLRDEYGHRGFYPSRYVEIPKWASDGRIIRLTRRSKKLFAVNVDGVIEAGMIAGRITSETCLVRGSGFILALRFDEFGARSATR